MIVQIVWPDCKFLGGKWRSDRAIDSFWVECSPEEGQHIIERYLGDGKERIHEPGPSLHREDGQLWQYFLISRDLSYVWSSPRVYPFSGQWNAYCPFRRLPHAIVIGSLEELANIHIPKEFRRQPAFYEPSNDKPPLTEKPSG
jgi:hypothetical protein